MGDKQFLVDEHTEATVRFVLAAVLLIIFVCFLVESHEYVKQQLKTSSNIPTEFKYTRNTLIAIFILNVVSHLIGACYHLTNYKFLYLSFLAWNLYSLLFILWLVFQFLRLYFSFRGTIFELSKPVQIWLFIQITAMILLYIVCVISIIVWFFKGEPSYGKLFLQIWDLIWYMLGISVLFSINITILFALKLWKLALQRRRSRTMADYNNSGINNSNTRNTNVSITSKSNISQQQFQLLDLSAKQTLLNVTQTILFIYYIMWFLIARYGYDKFNPLVEGIMNIMNITGDFICWTLWSLCLWLTFAFANKEYKIVCFLCHKCCLSCLLRLAEHVLTKSFQNPQQSLTLGNNEGYRLMKLNSNNVTPQ